MCLVELWASLVLSRLKRAAMSFLRVAANLVREGTHDPVVNGSTTDIGYCAKNVSVTPQSQGEHKGHYRTHILI